MAEQKPDFSTIPSLDRLLQAPAVITLVASHGRSATVAALRAALDTARGALAAGDAIALTEDVFAQTAAARLEREAAPGLRRVFNLTGTVLHTNLGRAPLAEVAITAMAEAARGASNLEYDLETGKRGDRDVHVEELLCELTGAEAATVVNNNAGAVLLLLNALALRKEVPVSRGELVEIGGAFRIPDIMARAGAKLVEVGTTNRTHAKDFVEAIGDRTALVMKVHTSNYLVQGFTADVAEDELAAIAHARDIPFAVDLGAGALVDLERWGLPHEPTARETLGAGADIITFSGDKLLGGPQSGLIVGRADLIAKLKKNPLKRALRCDKATLAALAATLGLYRDPDRLAERLPTLRLLSRDPAEIRKLAESLTAPVQAAVGDGFTISVNDCAGQIGSGALPVESLDSVALVIRPVGSRGQGARLKRLAASLRALPVPVIGRVHDDALWLDLRCLDDVDGFRSQLEKLQMT
ncbi:MAG: L-seryl-tRNA(Sec) selenium transferase [Rhodospirillaceae bacterium]|jgi:L-seryl-tRNA(Ser) seleniumtransferase|nr:L-seryl-tRNA(Sec) selenium transferase [Rhodospirillaceae bacterium]MBT4773275.1 L-seryl-tRNA(Sec) selenium transferase [Rhodospirillaceae bacterium]MBT5356934.1 L-seryl-tRNA(Sec) selenium transferase [Rhodospirillaceae bacterium]MBT5770001.1 L-seryl-tRNA(Sec) selenium transferase [Rhodospirillaceae bacterium]